MSGGHAWLARPALGLVPDEPDQVPRLLAFRKAHPDVIIGDGGFGTWQARIPAPNGETVVTRYRLVELLDRLDEVTGQPEPAAPDEHGMAGRVVPDPACRGADGAGSCPRPDMKRTRPGTSLEVVGVEADQVHE